MILFRCNTCFSTDVVNLSSLDAPVMQEGAQKAIVIVPVLIVGSFFNLYEEIIIFSPPPAIIEFAIKSFRTDIIFLSDEICADWLFLRLYFETHSNYSFFAFILPFVPIRC